MSVCASVLCVAWTAGENDRASLLIDLSHQYISTQHNSAAAAAAASQYAGVSAADGYFATEAGSHNCLPVPGMMELHR